MSALTMRTPRWLGCILLVVGALDTSLWVFVIVALALIADESWGDMAGELFALWLLGVLAGFAGIRILRGTSRRGTADTT
jgi:hypothetical protein